MTNIEEWYDESTLARWCRSCGARSGELCRSMSGSVVRPHRARTQASSPRRARERRGVSPAVRLSLIRRSGGWCEVCPRIDAHAPRHAGTEAHHVLRRSQGGSDDPGNLLWACRRGHRLVHDHPARARAAGVLRGRATAG